MEYYIKNNRFFADLKGSFSLYEYKDDAILLNSINRIFDDIDFSFLMNSKLNINQKSNLIQILFDMNKELNISLNINHILVFNEFLDAINKFF